MSTAAASSNSTHKSSSGASSVQSGQSPANSPSLARTVNSLNNPNNSQRIGPYSLGKTLGVGSTGRVKLGTHIETRKMVAIKIIPKDSFQDKSADGKPVSPEKKASMNKKIEREITIMKLIQHPNVMQLHDVYETDKELFLILEHIEGGELFDYLVKKGRLSEGEALMFFQQIIFGVDFCHKHLICHRDLKPENLLLDRDLNVKIADFGMASIQGPGRMLETSCGSPHYASPEIIKGIKYDGPAADIWSCGVILYALLTGNLPFDDENIRRLLSKVKAGMYFIPDHVSPIAKDLIKRMLIIDPEKRITMKEIMRHQWFTSSMPKNGDQVLPGALEDLSLAKPVEDRAWADLEVVNSLVLLGWGEEEEIISNLVSEKPDSVKVFYNLLCRRKWAFFENYDVRKLNEWDVEGGPRRRAESYSSLDRDPRGLPSGSQNGSRGDIFRSEFNLLEGGNADLRKSNEEINSHKTFIEPRARAATTCSTISPVTSNPATPVAKRADSVKPKITTVASVKVNSPLANSTTADGTGSNETASPSTPPSNHTKPLTQQTVPQTPTSDSPSRLTISIPDKTQKASTANQNNQDQPPLSPLIADGVEDKKGGPLSPLATLSLGSPRFHRKKQEVPPTPTISSAPKRSWFANLLNFKPEVFLFSSTKGLEETQAFIVERLNQFEVKHQPRKEGGFKCKYDGLLPATASPISPMSANVLNSGEAFPLTATENQHSAPSSPKPDRSSNTSSTMNGSSSPRSPLPNGEVFTFQPLNSENGGGLLTAPQINAASSSSVKSCKFKIDIANVETSEGGVQLRISFVHQQGSFSTFQIVVNKFRSNWTIGPNAPSLTHAPQ